MTEKTKLKLVMTPAELSDDGELLDLMRVCIKNSRWRRHIRHQGVRQAAVRKNQSVSDRNRSKNTNIDGNPELAAMNIDETLAEKFDCTMWELANDLEVSKA